MRYVVVLLTDDGTGKMGGRWNVVEDDTMPDGDTSMVKVGRLVDAHLTPEGELSMYWYYMRSIRTMQPMDMLFFGDSNRCAYVHRTQ